eukprot:scaffold497500_cov35-Prasinocladus_malaysianus.AAC.1
MQERRGNVNRPVPGVAAFAQLMLICDGELYNVDGYIMFVSTLSTQCCLLRCPGSMICGGQLPATSRWRLATAKLLRHSMRPQHYL